MKIVNKSFVFAESYNDEDDNLIVCDSQSTCAEVQQ